MTTATLDSAPKPRVERRPAGAARPGLRTAGLYVVSVLLGVGVWQLLAMHYGPSLVASPRRPCRRPVIWPPTARSPTRSSRRAAAS